MNTTEFKSHCKNARFGAVHQNLDFIIKDLIVHGQLTNNQKCECGVDNYCIIL